MLIAYSILICVGFGKIGMTGAVPVMCALVISSLAFVFTFLKSNGYLFNFKGYDMLMALPFKTRTVAACKFLYMYIKSLPWYLSISAAMLAGYAYYVRYVYHMDHPVPDPAGDPDAGGVIYRISDREDQLGI